MARTSYDAQVRIRRLLTIVALLGVAAWSAMPAGAHTQVQRATPAPGETVGGEVDVVVLDFLDPVLPTPEIRVTGPDGQPVAGIGAPELIADDVAVVRFDPLTAAGDYRVDYAFASLDGAPQEGAHQFRFAPSRDIEARPLLAGFVGAAVLALVVLAVVDRRRHG